MLALLLLIGSAQADESGCPAHKAAEAGFSPFDTLHQVIAPLWHNAYPDKDYQALIAGGDDLAKAFAGVAGIKPEIGNKSRLARFEKHRAELSQQIIEYAEASHKEDGKAAYEILPGLHESFEQAAAALLPVSYKEIEALYLTSGLIVLNHIPNKRIEGMTGSTATLVRKVEYLTEESIPDELKEHKADLLKKFVSLKKLASQMKQTCIDQDMVAFETYAKEIHEQLGAIVSAYL